MRIEKIEKTTDRYVVSAAIMNFDDTAFARQEFVFSEDKKFISVELLWFDTEKMGPYDSEGIDPLYPQ